MPETTKVSADSVASATQALLDSGLDAILQAVNRPLMVFSPEGQIIGVNAAARRLGTSQVGQMLVDSPWVQLRPELVDGLMAQFFKAAAGEVTRWLLPVPTEDQPSHRVGLLLSPVRNSRNQVTAVLMERDPLELAPSGGAATPERELRSIVESGRVAPGVWDVEDDRVWLHPMVYEVFHLPESFGGKKIEAYLDLIHSEDRAGVRANLDRALASGRDFKAEFRVPRADGTEAWLAVHGGVQRRASGRPIRIAGVALDITQRKQAERALRDSEERFRTIFEHCAAGISVGDFEGRFTNANQAYCNMLGYSEQQLRQMHVPDVMHPDQRHLVQEYLDRAKNGDAGPIQAERRMLRSDGQEIQVRISGGPMRSGNQVTGFIVVAQDITFEKRALEAIQESETRFRAMADCSPAFLWISDAAGYATFLNKAAAEFLGVDAEGVGNLSAFIHPEDLDPAMAVFEQAIAERRGFVWEYRVRRHDGVYRWVMSQGIPRFSSDGEFVGQGGSAIDVTDRLNAEQALRAELNRRTELEGELHALSERLIHAQEQTRQDIARELHDDLGQRVAAQGYALFNLKRKLPEITGEAQDAIRRLEESIAKLGADIRDLSHRLHPATLEHAGLRIALKALADEFSIAGLKVTAHLEGADQPLPAEVEVSLFRFAQEALQNVARHSGAAEAEVQLVQEGGRTQLRVSDRGAGFDPSAPSRAGLGLISMRERARLLRGSLILESFPDQGTTILLEIPSE